MNTLTLRTKFFLCLSILIFSSDRALSQTSPYDGFASDYYFGRQFSSRAEAMGQTFVAIDGDASSIHFNPAGIGNLKGLDLSSTYATPNYTLDDAKKFSFNAASRISKKMTLGLSRHFLDYGLHSITTDSIGNVIHISDNKITGTKFAVAYTVDPTFQLGGSLGILDFQMGGYSGKTLQLDFGILKKFKFSRFKNNQSLNLGTAIKNPVGTDIELKNNGQSGKATLPLIMQSGVSYYYTSEQQFHDLHKIKLIAAIEYQTLFNSNRFNNKYSTGVELTFLELIHLRGGYFLQTVNGFTSPKNKSKLEDITYGIGLTIPFDKLTSAPLQLSLDYCSMPQPSYTVNNTWPNFYSYTARLYYILF